ncbi:MAG: ABC transporter ATP-binding protein, partial [Rhodoferax sp.]|nr:ABC transporter ATP-binding protein [Rhodoferax sp.]
MMSNTSAENLLLQTQGLNAWYGAAQILFDVSLNVGRFLGRDISQAQPYQVARQGLGFVPEDRRIFSDLTVLENLSVGKQASRHFQDGSPVPYWTHEKIFSLFPNL